MGSTPQWSARDFLVHRDPKMRGPRYGESIAFARTVPVVDWSGRNIGSQSRKESHVSSPGAALARARGRGTAARGTDRLVGIAGRGPSARRPTGHRTARL